MEAWSYAPFTCVVEALCLGVMLKGTVQLAMLARTVAHGAVHVEIRGISHDEKGLATKASQQGLVPSRQGRQQLLVFFRMGQAMKALGQRL